MREGGKEPGSISGVGFATAGPSVAHVIEHFPSIEEDLVASATLDVGYEPHAATVFFIAWIIEAYFFWKAFKSHWLGEFQDVG